MLPVPERVRKNWAVMGYLFGLVRQIDPDLKFAVDTFTLVGFLWFSKDFLQKSPLIYVGHKSMPVFSTIQPAPHNAFLSLPEYPVISR